MIIVLKGADFSTSNIGTLSTWRITCSLGTGATYEGPNSVEKGSSLNANIFLQDGYRAIEEQIVIKMGGVVVEDAYTMISGEEPYIISIPSVTGNVTIVFPTEAIVPDEPDVPVTPDEPETPSQEITGSGTQADPYMLSTAQHLVQLGTEVDGGDAKTNVYYALANDLDLTGLAWNPIGDNATSGGIGFGGIFDGRGYVIRNISIAQSAAIKYAGLFGTNVTGTIMNLGMEGGSIAGTNVGSIARKLTTGGKIVNCYSLVDTAGNTRSGGITDDAATGTGIFGTYYGGTATPNGHAFHAASATGETISYCYWDTNKTLSGSSNDATLTGGISTSEFATLHDTLNTNLSAVATASGVSVDNLCTWEAGADGYPRLVKK